MAEASQYEDIRGYVAALVKQGIGAANVFPMQRHTGDWKAMLAMFRAGTPPDETFHGWTVSRSAVLESWLTNTEMVCDHTFKVRGVMGVKDSQNTELTFNAVVEAVRLAFRADFNLAGTCEFHEPIQFPIIDYRIFGGVLCHYAEGSVLVRERLQGGV